jgi:hypothetical protein
MGAIPQDWKDIVKEKEETETIEAVETTDTVEGDK